MLTSPARQFRKTSGALARLADDGAEHSGEGGNETVREPNPGLIVLPGPQAAINRAADYRVDGHDWAPRYPLIVEAINRLEARSCLIDGEAIACDATALPCSFSPIDWTPTHLGNLTRWNDPRIAAANPNLKLPDLPITVAPTRAAQPLCSPSVSPRLMTPSPSKT